MISKIKFLKCIGKFYECSAKGDGLDWHKNTFIFAPNAYGKSTLVNIIRSLRENDPNLIRSRKTLNTSVKPEAVIIVDGVNHIFNGAKWDRTHSAIQIFDMPYIHANILAHEIEHEHRKSIHRIIIGAQGIKLAEELSSLKDQEKDRRKYYEKLEKLFKTSGFKHHELNAFLAILATEENAVASRIYKLEQDIKSKESETQVRALTTPRALSVPAFDLATVKTLAAQKITSVHESAERRVLAHIERNFKNRGPAKEFIRQGLDLVQHDCPFCGQDLKNASDLMKAYQEYFDDAFRIYQHSLNQQALTLANWNLDNDLTMLVSTHNANLIKFKEWEPFIGAEILPDIARFVEEFRTKLTDLKAKIQTELEKKHKDPNADVELSIFDTMNSELSDIKTAVESYNNAVIAFTNKAKDYLANLPKSDIPSIKLALVKEQEIEKRFKQEWKEWVTEYLAIKKNAEDLLEQKKAKQKELDDYTKVIFKTYQKRINDLLITLGADFAITDLTGKIDERANEPYSDFAFLILQKKIPITTRHEDAACFRNTLSEGDKSTLAFAFFIAALEKIPNLDNQIVILDDPLSSLDETRREATARILLDLSPKLNQLCVFTHKKDFLYMLFDKISDNTVLQVRSDKKNGSSIELFDVEDDRKGEYAHMVEDMGRYVDEDFGPTPDTMQGNIRKVFEVVLKTKYYHALVADIKAKKGFAKLLETLFNEAILDTTLKTKLFDLCSVTNGPHHGEIVDTPSIKLARDELVPLIREAFSLLEKV